MEQVKALAQVGSLVCRRNLTTVAEQHGPVRVGFSQGGRSFINRLPILGKT